MTDGPNDPTPGPPDPTPDTTPDSQPAERRIIIRAPGQEPTAPEGGGRSAEGSGGASPSGTFGQAAPPEEITSSPPKPLVIRRIEWGPALAGLGGLLGAFSIIPPWWELSFKRIELLDSNISGLSAWPGIVSVVCAWVLLLALAYDIQKPGSDWTPIVGLSAALVLTLAALFAVVSPTSVTDSDPALTVTAALGAWMALAGGLLGLAGYGFVFARRR